MCCRGLSKFYLVALNLVTALLGLAVVGVAAYALVEYSDIDSILSKKATYGTLSAGIVLFLFSLLGCCAARSQNRCALLVYVLALLVIGAAQIIAGAAIANYAGELSIENGNIDNLSGDVADFVTCSYEYCCGKEIENCKTDVWQNDGFCKILPDDLANHDSPECASEIKYNQAVVDWIKSNEEALAIAALTLGGIELLAVLFGVYLLCAAKPLTEEELEEKRRLQQQKNAGSLAYGSAQPVAGGAARYV